MRGTLDGYQGQGHGIKTFIFQLRVPVTRRRWRITGCILHDVLFGCSSLCYSATVGAFLWSVVRFDGWCHITSLLQIQHVPETQTNAALSCWHFTSSNPASTVAVKHYRTTSLIRSVSLFAIIYRMLLLFPNSVRFNIRNQLHVKYVFELTVTSAQRYGWKPVGF